MFYNLPTTAFGRRREIIKCQTSVKIENTKIRWSNVIQNKVSSMLFIKISNVLIGLQISVC